MLKRLAKYGNSTTLVIDKTILELLDMKESSIVKLKIDGPSLVITPVNEINQDKRVSYSGRESLDAFNQTMNEKAQKQIKEMSPEEKAMIPEMQKEFENLFKKHKNVFAHTQNKSPQEEQHYQEELKAITEKVDPTKNPEAFSEELQKLSEKFYPEMKSLQKEIAAKCNKYKTIKK